MLKNLHGKIVRLSGFNCWGIKTTHGEKFEPLNLPDDLKIDGLDVVFSGSIAGDYASMNMYGKAFYISEINTV